MTVTLLKKGDIWRTLFSTWRVEADGIDDVSFPFSAGFGCGQAMKVTQGQKLSLQTQHKLGAQLGGKLTAPGVELSSGFSVEITETLVHEISATYEWSYTSRPCEYCLPRVHFPNSRIQVLTRFSLHLPLFGSRRTVFLPGETYEIRGHCKHAPDKCENCKESSPQAGGGAILTSTHATGTSYIERVLLAERTPKIPDPEQLLKTLDPPQDSEPAPSRLYLVDLYGRARAVDLAEHGYTLYSLDDVDRAMGAIRLYRAGNQLVLLARLPDGEPGPSPDVQVELISKESQEPIVAGEIAVKEGPGFRLLLVTLNCTNLQAGHVLEDQPTLTLRLRTNRRTTDWPAILVRGGDALE